MKSRHVEKRLLTIKETAKYLGCSIWTVRELIWDRKLPEVRRNRNGGKIYLDIRDLEKYIEQNKQYF